MHGWLLLSTRSRSSSCIHTTGSRRAVSRVPGSVSHARAESAIEVRLSGTVGYDWVAKSAQAGLALAQACVMLKLLVLSWRCLTAAATVCKEGCIAAAPSVYIACT